jgi:hypothetical protein
MLKGIALASGRPSRASKPKLNTQRAFGPSEEQRGVFERCNFGRSVASDFSKHSILGHQIVGVEMNRLLFSILLR